MIHCFARHLTWIYTICIFEYDILEYKRLCSGKFAGLYATQDWHSWGINLFSVRSLKNRFWWASISMKKKLKRHAYCDRYQRYVFLYRTTLVQEYTYWQVLMSSHVFRQLDCIPNYTRGIYAGYMKVKEGRIINMISEIFHLSPPEACNINESSQILMNVSYYLPESNWQPIW